MNNRLQAFSWVAPPLLIFLTAAKALTVAKAGPARLSIADTGVKMRGPS